MQELAMAARKPVPEAQEPTHPIAIPAELTPNPLPLAEPIQLNAALEVLMPLKEPLELPWQSDTKSPIIPLWPQPKAVEFLTVEARIPTPPTLYTVQSSTNSFMPCSEEEPLLPMSIPLIETPWTDTLDMRIFNKLLGDMLMG
jgi:hypothetical protein